MKRNYLLGASLAVTLALGISACSAGSGSNEGSGSAEGGDVTLQMIESLSGPDRAVLLRGILDDFETANPGIKVELISPPTEQADGKIQQMLQAGTGLDVVEVRDLTVGAWANNGWLYDMKAEFDGWEGYDALSENTKAIVDGNEKMHYMPYGYFGLSLFYRTDLVEQAGAAGPPSTWEELAEQAVKIQTDIPNQYGLALRGGKNGIMHAMHAIESYTADKLDLSNVYLQKDGSTIFAAPEAKEALELYTSIYKNGGAPESAISFGFPEMVEAFNNGSTAFLLQDPEVITALKGSSSITADQWTTAPVLTGPSGKAIRAEAFSGWGVAEGSEHKEEAVKLVQFLTSGQASLDFAQGNNQIPILAEGTQSDYYKEGPWESYFAMDAEPDKFIVGKEPRGVEWWGEWSEMGDADLQQILLGKANVDDTLKKWDEYWSSKY